MPQRHIRSLLGTIVLFIASIHMAPTRAAGAVESGSIDGQLQRNIASNTLRIGPQSRRPVGGVIATRRMLQQVSSNGIHLGRVQPKLVSGEPLLQRAIGLIATVPLPGGRWSLTFGAGLGQSIHGASHPRAP